jgi:hypothetical protein
MIQWGIPKLSPKSNVIGWDRIREFYNIVIYVNTLYATGYNISFKDGSRWANGN